MSTHDCVSVIMPAFNAEATIQASLDSVLTQSYPPSEIIVVDDGSTDGTAAIVATYGAHVTYHWQANTGPAEARNVGLKLAHGDLVTFLDADDLWPANALQVLVAALASHPAAAVVHGQVRDMWPDTQGGWALDLPHRGFNLGSAIFRRSVFEQIGVFNPQLRQSEDVDFWVRIREHNLGWQTIEDVTLLYRRRPVYATDIRVYHAHWLHNLKRSLDRQRGK